MPGYLFIVNTHSGGGRAVDEVKALLAGAASPAARCETAFTEAPGHAGRIAREAAASFDVLVACGGDGTVGEVAGGLIASGAAETRLAILPLGTGNDAARVLGVGEWDAAVAALWGSRWRAMDVCHASYTVAGGATEERVALVGVGAGLPAHVVAVATRRVKHALGRWGYLVTAVGCVATYRCPRMRIVADGNTREGEYSMCGVANMEYTAGHSIRMAPGARCDDGALDAILVRRTARLVLLSRLGHIRRGTHPQLPEVEYFPVREISLDATPPTEVTVDGDCCGTTPARFRVLPGALRVMVPE